MNRFSSEKSKNSPIRKMLPLITAVVGIVFILSLTFSFESETKKFHRWKSEYSATPKIELQSQLDRPPSSIDSMLRIGITHYLNTDYKAARDHFKHIPTDEKTQLYIAHTYFQENQPSMASGFYKALVFSQNKENREEAQWFWVQCNLKELPDKYVDLVSGLRLITNTEGAHKYKEQAGQLLQEVLQTN